MIGRLTGTLVTKRAPDILIDVNGVGYELEAPMTTFYDLPSEGSDVTLHTHLVVREDANLLYGFVKESERALFRMLIKVNGVGPKLAITILSGISSADFARCVTENDVTTLVRLPGVGKKTAERLVIEMRDRLPQMDQAPSDRPSNTQVSPAFSQGATKDAIGALVSLGYKQHEADRMIQQVDTAGRLSEDIIRDALRAVVR